MPHAMSRDDGAISSHFVSDVTSESKLRGKERERSPSGHETVTKAVPTHHKVRLRQMRQEVILFYAVMASCVALGEGELLAALVR